MFKAPLVVFGENPQFEYGGPEHSRNNMIMDKKWRQELGGMRGFREEDVIDVTFPTFSRFRMTL